jgi:hypothetical protein
MYNVSVGLQGHTVWPVGLKFFCRALQTSTWAEKKNTLIFNFQTLILLSSVLARNIPQNGERIHYFIRWHISEKLYKAQCMGSSGKHKSNKATARYIDLTAFVKSL